MKKTQMVIATLMIISTVVFAQKSMGVRVGGPVQSYYIGIGQSGSILVGVDYWGGSIKLDSDYHYEEDYYGDQYTDDDEITVDGNLRLIMPRIGFKYYQAPKQDIKSYLLVEGFMVIPLVNFETTESGETYELEDDEKDMVKDALDFMGLTVGVGSEYYFSQQFSIGAEFGLNLVLWNYSDKYYDTGGDGDYSWEESYKYEASAELSGGFARMTVNFHF